MISIEIYTFTYILNGNICGQRYDNEDPFTISIFDYDKIQELAPQYSFIYREHINPETLHQYRIDSKDRSETIDINNNVHIKIQASRIPKERFFYINSVLSFDPDAELKRFIEEQVCKNFDENVFSKNLEIEKMLILAHSKKYAFFKEHISEEFIKQIEGIINKYYYQKNINLLKQKLHNSDTFKDELIPFFNPETSELNINESLFAYFKSKNIEILGEYLTDDIVKEITKAIKEHSLSHTNRFITDFYSNIFLKIDVLKVIQGCNNNPELIKQTLISFMIKSGYYILPDNVSNEHIRTVKNEVKKFSQENIRLLKRKLTEHVEFANKILEFIHPVTSELINIEPLLAFLQSNDMYILEEDLTNDIVKALKKDEHMLIYYKCTIDLFIKDLPKDISLKSGLLEAIQGCNNNPELIKRALITFMNKSDDYCIPYDYLSDKDIKRILQVLEQDSINKDHSSSTLQPFYKAKFSYGEIILENIQASQFNYYITKENIKYELSIVIRILE